MSQMGLQIPTYDENRSQVVHRGGRMQSRDNNRVIATINWHAKIKKYEYKLNKWLYGQSSDGHKKWMCLTVEMASWDLPSI